MSKEDTPGFFARDHRYVLLGTSVLAALGVYALNAWRSQFSFLTGIPYFVIAGILELWLLVSLVGLVQKLMWWHSYAEKSFFTKEPWRRVLRYGSYLVWLTTIVALIDSPIMGIIGTAQQAIASPTRPTDFFEASVYVAWTARDMFITGVITTVEIAVFGTAIAFILAILLVFLRIQIPDRTDNDFIKFWKVVGCGFAKVYSTIIRGTPMMIQALIIWGFGFSLFRNSGMTAMETRAIWSPFIAGLVTVILNSTAYMMEVLRGGIESVDFGQTEAARSLGLSQWQAMMKVVFPQGVKNSVPALSNELVINIKDSSVLSVIAVFDLMYATTTATGAYYITLEIYLIAAVLYLMLTMTATWLLNRLAKRLDVAATTLPSSN